MKIDALYAQHIEILRKRYAEAIEALTKSGQAIDAVLLHSGSETVYYADDEICPFKAYGHFAQWLPVERPDQMVLVEPGKKPVYYRVVPRDYWYDQTVPSADWWTGQFDIVDLIAPEEVFDHLPPHRRIAFMGENTAFAATIGLPSTLQNHPQLKNRLDYPRAYKTDYEVARLREANKMAIVGQEAARGAFERRGSEWRIHMDYLNACGVTEHETPFPNIVALDEKSAILHYQHRRHDGGDKSRVLLVDAGYRLAGYCSDLTRTYARDDAHPVFRALLKGMDRLQREIVALSKPGLPFADLHIETHRKVRELLKETGIVTGSDAEIETHSISRLFFPHGLGHLLGIQVHDVGGHLKNAEGELNQRPTEHPFLRLTRQLEPGMVFTVEPGLYFIPTLLDPERNTEKGCLLNWRLIDELLPFGGIRIEDNVLITAQGHENLTR